MADKKNPDSRKKTSVIVLAVLLTVLAGSIVRAVIHIKRHQETMRLNTAAAELIAHGSLEILHEGHEHGAECNHSAGDASEAKEAYHIALEKLEKSRSVNPSNPQTWTLLGDVHHNLGNDKDSIDSYKQASILASDDADTHADLGMEYAHQRNYSKAKASFERAVELSPRDVGCLRFLVLICDKQGNRKEAREYAKRLLAVAKNDPIAKDVLKDEH